MQTTPALRVVGPGTEPPKFLLVSRGFRWINERPVNR